MWNHSDPLLNPVFSYAVFVENEAPAFASHCSHSHFVLVSQVRLLLELYRLQGNITRVKINELKPLKPRYEVPDVLIREPTTEPWVSCWGFHGWVEVLMLGVKPKTQEQEGYLFQRIFK